MGGGIGAINLCWVIFTLDSRRFSARAGIGGVAGADTGSLCAQEVLCGNLVDNSPAFLPCGSACVGVLAANRDMKNEVLRGNPPGVGIRECGFIDLVVMRSLSLLVLRRVSVENLFSAVERDDFFMLGKLESLRRPNNS